MESFDFGGEIVWRPTPEHIANSNLKRFMDRHNLATFDSLMERSTNDIDWFWEAVLHELDIRFETPYSRIVDLSRGNAWPEWCADGRMNIVHN